jgi:alkylhydroperoxidase family enzyme
MTRVTAMVGVMLNVVLLAPFAAEAQERVKPFDRLDRPRIAVPADPGGASEMRQLCPENTEPETCGRYWAYTGYFVRNATIPARDRELLILRTAWLNRGDYIWGRHNVMGREAGLTEQEISRVMQGPGASGWSAFDTALLRAADELFTSRFISRPTWNALAARYKESHLREVVLIVGNYTQLAMFQNTLGAQLEPGYTGLPESRRR